jgi:HEAT repeat protein
MDGAIPRPGRRHIRRAASRLINALDDRSNSVRRDAAEALACHKGRAVVKALIRSLQDRDELVVVNALESLSALRSRKASPTIARLLSDRRWIVRGYAGSSLGSVGSRAFLAKLSSAYSREKNQWVRLMMLRGLHGMGLKVAIWDFLRFWYSPSYRVRSMLVDTLASVGGGTDKRMLRSFFRYAFAVEKTRAVRSAIAARARSF